MKNNIVICGFMGAGKTTFGKKLAQKRNLNFYDIDELIELKEKISIADLFKIRGEKYFRNLEAMYCRKLSKMENIVISTGGGTFDIEENVLLFIKNFDIILLDIDFETCYSRIKNTDRPLVQRNNFSYLKSLFTIRRKKFLNFANIIISKKQQ